MPGIEQQFEQAVARVKAAPADGAFKPSNALRLKMYALYRQARHGDVSGKRPGLLAIVERAKHDAWAAAAGMSREDAMRAYSDEVQRIERQYG